MLSKELQKVSEVVAKMDCGDSSCLFAVKKGGMRTNGGCTCFDRGPNGQLVATLLIEMLPDLLELAQKEEDLLGDVEAFATGQLEAAREINRLGQELATMRADNKQVLGLVSRNNEYLRARLDEAVRLLAKLYHDYNSTFVVGAWDEHLRKFVMTDVAAFLARVSR